MERSCLDFDLRLDEDSDGDYRVAVIDSPVGEITEDFRIPFPDLERELLSLENAVLRSAPQTLSRRRLFSGQEQEAQDFGSKLFDSLFSGNIRSLYDQSRQVAGEGGLRIRLRINAPKLAAIPWEFLYDPRGAGSFIALNLRTPLVRYMETPHPARDICLRPGEPIRVLGMAAAPEDQAELNVEQERKSLQDAVDDLPNVRLEWVQGETWRDLVSAFDRAEWHVLHFIGHGLYDPRTGQGLLALCTEQHTTHALSATDLAVLIADHYTLRFVFLNSCEGAKSAGEDLYSSAASILVANGVPAVLAMQYEIYDLSALEFSRTLYEALARGDPVDRAVTLGRKAIKVGTKNVMEWGTPVLTMRLADGVLFRREGPADGQEYEEVERTTDEEADYSARQPEARVELKTPDAEAVSQHQPFKIPRRVRRVVGIGLLAVLLLAGGVLLASSLLRPGHGGGNAESNSQWMPVIESFDDVDMVQVPAGCFMMGGDSSANEARIHEVCFDEPFWIDRTEVTNAQFARFDGDAERGGRWTDADRPREQIAWTEAQSFCAKRGARLPTEAEWEYAARGPDGLTYPWGNSFEEDNVVYAKNSGHQTEAVDQRPGGASWVDALGLSGNVSEWVNDLFGGDGERAVNSPGALSIDTYGVVRGGSLISNLNFLRATYRVMNPASKTSHVVGFRCARDAE